MYFDYYASGNIHVAILLDNKSSVFIWLEDNILVKNASQNYVTSWSLFSLKN